MDEINILNIFNELQLISKSLSNLLDRSLTQTD
jgi:hypothetical protein